MAILGEAVLVAGAVIPAAVGAVIPVVVGVVPAAVGVDPTNVARGAVLRVPRTMRHRLLVAIAVNSSRVALV
ncbi:MAG: hypothetical protein HQL60_01665 [Magnetococcales bacterium]|nr:hypothetical protein [Magnetococcales bacterium]